MLDKNEFNGIREELNKFEEKREEVIRLSRDIIYLSKRIIYGVQRNDNVDGLVSDIKAKVKELPTNHYDADIQFVAVQEYVEALCFYVYIKETRVPTRKELEVDTESYLLGLCDFTGELVRQAVNDVIKKRFTEAKGIKSLVEEIYGEFLKFNLRGGQLRKKADSIKWNLKKLEDLALGIAARD